MNSEQKTRIHKWLHVLKAYVDPIQLMDKFPTLFKLNSEPRTKVMEKYEQPHKAVEIVVTELLQYDSEVDLFKRFVGAIRETGHAWLSELISGETCGIEAEQAASEMENADYVTQFFTVMLPHIKSIIDADDIAFRLKCATIITDDDLQVVKAKADSKGRSMAVQQLLAILVRKAPGWWREFTKILVELKYDADLVTALYDMQSCSSSSSNESSHSLKIRGQGSADNLAKYGADEVSPWIQLHRSQWSRALIGENVIIVLPYECGKAWTVAKLAELQHLGKVIGFLVTEADKAKCYTKEIQGMLSSDGVSVTCLAGAGSKLTENALSSLSDKCSVMVMTPMKMVNALRQNKSLLFKFDILIFEDCAPTMQEKPDDQILRQYFRMEDSVSFSRPQIIGLTSIARMPLENSMDDMISLLAKYDSHYGGPITIPVGYKDDVFRPLEVVLEKGSASDQVSDPVTLAISKAMDEVTDHLSELDTPIIKGFEDPCDLAKGTKQYIHWCKDMIHRVVILANSENERHCIEVQKYLQLLLVLNKALDLKFKCTAVSAMKHLQSYKESLCEGSSNLEGPLYDIMNKTLAKVMETYEDPRCLNSALYHAKKKVQDLLSKDCQCKVLVVVLREKYLVSIADYWRASVTNDESGRWNALMVLGVQSEGESLKTLENSWQKVEQALNGKRAALVISTPEIASGISSKVDLVVYYDCLKSQISCSESIQFSSGQIVLKNNPKISAALLAEKAIQRFQLKYDGKKDLYYGEIKKLQRVFPEPEPAAPVLATNGDRTVHRQESNSSDGIVVCRGKTKRGRDCNTLVCYIKDIIVLPANYTCMTKEFKDRYASRKQCLFCPNCDSKWGIFSTYKALKDIPQLKANAFLFYADHDSAPMHGKKWEMINIKFRRPDYDEVWAMHKNING